MVEYLNNAWISNNAYGGQWQTNKKNWNLGKEKLFSKRLFKERDYPKHEILLISQRSIRNNFAFIRINRIKIIQAQENAMNRRPSWTSEQEMSSQSASSLDILLSGRSILQSQLSCPMLKLNSGSKFRRLV